MQGQNWHFHLLQGLIHIFLYQLCEVVFLETACFRLVDPATQQLWEKFSRTGYKSFMGWCKLRTTRWQNVVFYHFLIWVCPVIGYSWIAVWSWDIRHEIWHSETSGWFQSPSTTCLWPETHQSQRDIKRRLQTDTAEFEFISSRLRQLFYILLQMLINVI